MFKKKAFTLAETLIVLTVIAIVALLTIPARITDVQNKARITYISKAYEALNNVYDYALTEGNNVVGACVGTCTGVTSNTTLAMVVENMFYNNMRAMQLNTDNPDKISFKTRDGMVFTFFDFNDRCPVLNNTDKSNALVSAASVADQYCFKIFVDINGGAGPNMTTDYAAMAADPKKKQNWGDQYTLYAFRDTIDFLTPENVLFYTNKENTQSSGTNNKDADKDTNQTNDTTQTNGSPVE